MVNNISMLGLQTWLYANGFFIGGSAGCAEIRICNSLNRRACSLSNGSLSISITKGHIELLEEIVKGSDALTPISTDNLGLQQLIV